MPRKKLDELTMQAAAFLYSQRYSREEIGHILKISQPSVSRSIQHAIEKGWVESVVRFATDKIPTGRVEEINALISPKQQLEKWFERFASTYGLTTIPDYRVLPSANRSTDAAKWEERITQFGDMAAEPLRNLLRPTKVCGISWGYTITSIVQGLRKLDPLSLHTESVMTFIPLCGEPLGKPYGKAVTQLSASSLAEQFDQLFNGHTEHSPTMFPVPAIILHKDQEKVKTIREFFESNATGYREIFYGEQNNGQQEEPLIDKLDTILTGVGAPTHPRGYWGDALISTKGINWERLSTLIIGDIGGVLFPHPAIERNEPEELKVLRDGWMGIDEDHMRKCAEKAAHNKTAGVIVVAIGANKAKSVYESMKRKLVNTLLIDLDLAEALLQIQE